MTRVAATEVAIDEATRTLDLSFLVLDSGLSHGK